MKKGDASSQKGKVRTVNQGFWGAFEFRLDTCTHVKIVSVFFNQACMKIFQKENDGDDIGEKNKVFVRKRYVHQII